jgi:hypothetical protein
MSEDPEKDMRLYQANLIVDGTTGELVPAPWMEADPTGRRELRCLICGYVNTTEFFDLRGPNPGLQDATFCPRCASTRGCAWVGTA